MGSGRSFDTGNSDGRVSRSDDLPSWAAIYYDERPAKRPVREPEVLDARPEGAD